MTDLIQYTLEAGFILAALCLFYRGFLEDRVSWQLSRGTLLLIPLLAFGIPLIHVSGNELLSSHWLEETMLSASGVDAVAEGNAFSWTTVVLLIFGLGMAFRLLRLAYGLFTLARYHREGAQKSGKLRIVTSARVEAPFSFFNRVFLPEEIGSAEKKVILSHEEGHYRARHAWDLLYFELVMLFQWFNPAAWALSRSLKQVHEYEADSRTLQQGVGRNEYQKLIYKHIVTGAPFLPVNHFSKNSVKRRIMMMNTSNPKSGAGWRLLAALPLLALSLFLFSFTSSPASGGTDKMPEYPGGNQAMKEYMWKNFSYPEEAKAAGIEGKVVVSFVVAKDGSITKTKVIKGIGYGCDVMAKNLVEAMPKWKPGVQDGKTVAVEMKLPVSFVLPKEK